ncbi:unnamed protein product [Arabis nemorensis]|uniref:Uncharacterized protein n=1 Tax=Arabis nemorensis TaxID=586526 RepID=A0A565B6T7_9BRAS|nr:unnamed protein product [Arabis nemorensis]
MKIVNSITLKEGMRNEYRKAVTDAKNEGNLATVYQIGAEKVRELLGVREELNHYIDGNGSPCVTMKVTHQRKVKKNAVGGGTIDVFEPTDYTVKSTQWR